MNIASEYMIVWRKPDGYDPTRVLKRLPSPISKDMREIYNYAVKPEGFYIVDRHVDCAVAGHAMKIFLDEALSHTNSVNIKKL